MTTSLNTIIKTLLGALLLAGILAYVWPVQINLDAAPYCPPGWKVVSHDKQANVRWSIWTMSAVEHRDEKRLAASRPLNACAIDYLRKHQGQIPWSWRISTNGYQPLYRFDGTVYETPEGFWVTRALIYNGDRWDETTSIVKYPEQWRRRRAAGPGHHRVDDEPANYYCWVVSTRK